MEIKNRGLKALTVEAEQQELRVIGIGRLILRYHKGSERTGKAYGIDCRLWDVLSPRLPNYLYDSDSHIPTLSVEGMKERGLLKCS